VAFMVLFTPQGPGSTAPACSLPHDTSELSVPSTEEVPTQLHPPVEQSVRRQEQNRVGGGRRRGRDLRQGPSYLPATQPNRWSRQSSGVKIRGGIMRRKSFFPTPVCPLCPGSLVTHCLSLHPCHSEQCRYTQSHRLCRFSFLCMQHGCARFLCTGPPQCWL
jgi:hypothetical protein